MLFFKKGASFINSFANGKETPAAHSASCNVRQRQTVHRRKREIKNTKVTKKSVKVLEKDRVK